VTQVAVCPQGKKKKKKPQTQTHTQKQKRQSEKLLDFKPVGASGNQRA
jgi:hypothetical protein